MFLDKVAVLITDSSVAPTSEDRPSLVLGLSVHSHLGHDRCSRKVWGLVTLPVSLCHGEGLDGFSGRRHTVAIIFTVVF